MPVLVPGTRQSRKAAELVDVFVERINQVPARRRCSSGLHHVGGRHNAVHQLLRRSGRRLVSSLAQSKPLCSVISNVVRNLAVGMDSSLRSRVGMNSHRDVAAVLWGTRFPPLVEMTRGAGHRVRTCPQTDVRPSSSSNTRSTWRTRSRTSLECWPSMVWIGRSGSSCRLRCRLRRTRCTRGSRIPGTPGPMSGGMPASPSHSIAEVGSAREPRSALFVVSWLVASELCASQSAC